MSKNQSRLHYPSQFPLPSDGPLKSPPFTITENGKYRLGSDFPVDTYLFGNDIDTDYCTLRRGGLLLIYSGFVWSGPRGLANTPHGLMPSATYACLRRLVREGWIPREAVPRVKLNYRIMLAEWRLPLWRRIFHLFGTCILVGRKELSPEPEQ